MFFFGEYIYIELKNSDAAISQITIDKRIVRINFFTSLFINFIESLSRL